MQPPQNVTVVLSAEGGDADDARRAAEFARSLGLPVAATQDSSAADYVLSVRHGRLSIDAPGAAGRGVASDFSRLDLRSGSGGISRKQPLAKAIGELPAVVVDATAGLGYDSVLLAALRYEVIAVERSPIVAALFEDGLRRACEQNVLPAEVIARVRLCVGDARDVLVRRGGLDPPPDVVYLDPMFPPKRKASALPRKPLLVLRDLVGDDPDAGELFEAAMRTASRRVVVKRRDDAPPLRERPTAQYRGKSARYDMYVPPGGAAATRTDQAS